MPSMPCLPSPTCQLPMGFSIQRLQGRHLHVHKAASSLLAAAASAAPSEVTVPRQPGVTDGVWSKADVQLVKDAIDFSRPSQRNLRAEHGELPVVGLRVLATVSCRPTLTACKDLTCTCRQHSVGEEPDQSAGVCRDSRATKIQRKAALRWAVAWSPECVGYQQCERPVISRTTHPFSC